MKKILIFTCLLLSLSLTGSVLGEILIDLDASDLPEGSLSTWTNDGTAGGEFVTADRTEVEGTDPNALVEIVDGIKAVSFPDGAWMESTVAAPNELAGDQPWSVVINAYAPTTTGEDCLFQWSNRDPGDGNNAAHFNFGTRAITFWWDVFYNNAPPTGQWVNLAYTFDGATVNLYVNGTFDNDADRTGLNLRLNDPMRIARAMPDAWGTHPFNGSIASIQVYDTALTELEIQQLSGLFDAGSLSGPASVIEGASDNLTLQINENPITTSGPATDLEVTLSFIGTYADAQLGTSAIGDPYVVTVPAAAYSNPISIAITPEDDFILETAHDVVIQAIVTAGDPDYVGLEITPFGGLAVTVVDNDYAPCPEPLYIDGGYLDDFDCEWDFGAGVTGMWDGIMNADNMSVGNTVDNPGYLTLDGTGNWNGNETNGPFFYTEVTGDFVAEYHQLEPVSSYAGLMVRLADPDADGVAGEDNMFLAVWANWNVGSIFWPVNDGGRPEWDITWDGADGPTWAKVERRGAEFYWSRSYDGVVWEPLPSAYPLVREDMDVETLQVGLVQGWSSAPVLFDYFKVSPPRGSLSGTLNLTESIGETGQVQFQLDPPPAGVVEPFADISVEISAVAVPGADPNSEPNDIMIGTSANGEPYGFVIPAANYDQPQVIDITAVIDAIDELDQQLTLVADVNCADPNWSGMIILNDVVINVLETPGLVIDSGDGVEVSEDGVTDTFTVRLKTAPTAGVTIDIVDDADPDQLAAIASLSFNSGDFMTPQVVTVGAIDDAELETDPHSTTLSVTPSNGAEYDLEASSVDVDILENECGAWGYNWADFDTDCDVDLADLQTMASSWLDCSNPYDPGCIDYR